MQKIVSLEKNLNDRFTEQLFFNGEEFFKALHNPETVYNKDDYCIAEGSDGQLHYYKCKDNSIAGAFSESQWEKVPFDNLFTLPGNGTFVKNVISINKSKDIEENAYAPLYIEVPDSGLIATIEGTQTISSNLYKKFSAHILVSDGVIKFNKLIQTEKMIDSVDYKVINGKKTLILYLQRGDYTIFTVENCDIYTAELSYSEDDGSNKFIRNLYTPKVDTMKSLMTDIDSWISVSKSDTANVTTNKYPECVTIDGDYIVFNPPKDSKEGTVDLALRTWQTSPTITNSLPYVLEIEFTEFTMDSLTLDDGLSSYNKMNLMHRNGVGIKGYQTVTYTKDNLGKNYLRVKYYKNATTSNASLLKFRLAYSGVNQCIKAKFRLIYDIASSAATDYFTQIDNPVKVGIDSLSENKITREIGVIDFKYNNIPLSLIAKGGIMSSDGYSISPDSAYGTGSNKLSFVTFTFTAPSNLNSGTSLDKYVYTMCDKLPTNNSNYVSAKYGNYEVTWYNSTTKTINVKLSYESLKGDVSLNGFNEYLKDHPFKILYGFKSNMKDESSTDVNLVASGETRKVGNTFYSLDYAGLSECRNTSDYSSIIRKEEFNVIGKEVSLILPTKRNRTIISDNVPKPINIKSMVNMANLKNSSDDKVMKNYYTTNNNIINPLNVGMCSALHGNGNLLVTVSGLRNDTSKTIDGTTYRGNLFQYIKVYEHGTSNGWQPCQINNGGSNDYYYRASSSNDAQWIEKVIYLYNDVFLFLYHGEKELSSNSEDNLLLLAIVEIKKDENGVYQFTTQELRDYPSTAIHSYNSQGIDYEENNRTFYILEEQIANRVTGISIRTISDNGSIIRYDKMGSRYFLYNAAIDTSNGYKSSLLVNLERGYNIVSDSSKLYLIKYGTIKGEQSPDSTYDSNAESLIVDSIVLGGYSSLWFNEDKTIVFAAMYNTNKVYSFRINYGFNTIEKIDEITIDNFNDNKYHYYLGERGSDITVSHELKEFAITMRDAANSLTELSNVNTSTMVSFIEYDENGYMTLSNSKLSKRAQEYITASGNVLELIQYLPGKRLFIETYNNERLNSVIFSSIQTITSENGPYLKMQLPSAQKKFVHREDFKFSLPVDPESISIHENDVSGSIIVYAVSKDGLYMACKKLNVKGDCEAEEIYPIANFTYGEGWVKIKKTYSLSNNKVLAICSSTHGDFPVIIYYGDSDNLINVKSFERIGLFASIDSVQITEIDDLNYLIWFINGNLPKEVQLLKCHNGEITTKLDQYVYNIDTVHGDYNDDYIRSLIKGDNNSVIALTDNHFIELSFIKDRIVCNNITREFNGRRIYTKTTQIPNQFKGSVRKPTNWIIPYSDRSFSVVLCAYMNELDNKPCFFIMANHESSSGVSDPGAKNVFINYPPLKLLRMNENWFITIFDHMRNTTNESKSWPQYQIFNVGFTKGSTAIDTLSITAKSSSGNYYAKDYGPVISGDYRESDNAVLVATGYYKSNDVYKFRFRYEELVYSDDNYTVNKDSASYFVFDASDINEVNTFKYGDMKVIDNKVYLLLGNLYIFILNKGSDEKPVMTLSKTIETKYHTGGSFVTSKVKDSLFFIEYDSVELTVIDTANDIIVKTVEIGDKNQKFTYKGIAGREISVNPRERVFTVVLEKNAHNSRIGEIDSKEENTGVLVCYNDALQFTVNKNPEGCLLKDDTSSYIGYERSGNIWNYQFISENAFYMVRYTGNPLEYNGTFYAQEDIIRIDCKEKFSNLPSYYKSSLIGDNNTDKLYFETGLKLLSNDLRINETYTPTTGDNLVHPMREYYVTLLNGTVAIDICNVYNNNMYQGFSLHIMSESGYFAIDSTTKSKLIDITSKNYYIGNVGVIDDHTFIVIFQPYNASSSAVSLGSNYFYYIFTIEERVKAKYLMCVQVENPTYGLDYTVKQSWVSTPFYGKESKKCFEFVTATSDSNTKIIRILTRDFSSDATNAPSLTLGSVPSCIRGVNIRYQNYKTYPETFYNVIVADKIYIVNQDDATVYRTIDDIDTTYGAYICKNEEYVFIAYTDTNRIAHLKSYRIDFNNLHEVDHITLGELQKSTYFVTRHNGISVHPTQNMLIVTGYNMAEESIVVTASEATSKSILVKFDNSGKLNVVCDDVTQLIDEEDAKIAHHYLTKDCSFTDDGMLSYSFVFYGLNPSFKRTRRGIKVLSTIDSDIIAPYNEIEKDVVTDGLNNHSDISWDSRLIRLSNDESMIAFSYGSAIIRIGKKENAKNTFLTDGSTIISLTSDVEIANMRWYTNEILLVGTRNKTSNKIYLSAYYVNTSTLATNLISHVELSKWFDESAGGTSTHFDFDIKVNGTAIYYVLEKYAYVLSGVVLNTSEFTVSNNNTGLILKDSIPGYRSINIINENKTDSTYCSIKFTCLQTINNVQYVCLATQYLQLASSFVTGKVDYLPLYPYSSDLQIMETSGSMNNFTMDSDLGSISIANIDGNNQQKVFIETGIKPSGEINFVVKDIVTANSSTGRNGLEVHYNKNTKEAIIVYRNDDTSFTVEVYDRTLSCQRHKKVYHYNANLTGSYFSSKLQTLFVPVFNNPGTPYVEIKFNQFGIKSKEDYKVINPINELSSSTLELIAIDYENSIIICKDYINKAIKLYKFTETTVDLYDIIDTTKIGYDLYPVDFVKTSSDSYAIFADTYYKKVVPVSSTTKSCEMHYKISTKEVGNKNILSGFNHTYVWHSSNLQFEFYGNSNSAQPMMIHNRKSSKYNYRPLFTQYLIDSTNLLTYPSAMTVGGASYDKQFLTNDLKFGWFLGIGKNGSLRKLTIDLLRLRYAYDGVIVPEQRNVVLNNVKGFDADLSQAYNCLAVTTDVGIKFLGMVDGLTEIRNIGVLGTIEYSTFSNTHDLVSPSNGNYLYKGTQIPFVKFNNEGNIIAYPTPGINTLGTTSITFAEFDNYGVKAVHSSSTNGLTTRESSIVTIDTPNQAISGAQFSADSSKLILTFNDIDNGEKKYLRSIPNGEADVLNADGTVTRKVGFLKVTGDEDYIYCPTATDWVNSSYANDGTSTLIIASMDGGTESDDFVYIRWQFTQFTNSDNAFDTSNTKMRVLASVGESLSRSDYEDMQTFGTESKITVVKDVNGHLVMTIKKTALKSNSKDDIINFLKAHPIYILYELETPYTEDYVLEGSGEVFTGKSVSKEGYISSSKVGDNSNNIKIIDVPLKKSVNAKSSTYTNGSLATSVEKHELSSIFDIEKSKDTFAFSKYPFEFPEFVRFKLQREFDKLWTGYIDESLITIEKSENGLVIAGKNPDKIYTEFDRLNISSYISDFTNVSHTNSTILLANGENISVFDIQSDFSSTTRQDNLCLVKDIDVPHLNNFDRWVYEPAIYSTSERFMGGYIRPDFLSIQNVDEGLFQVKVFSKNKGYNGDSNILNIHYDNELYETKNYFRPEFYMKSFRKDRIKEVGETIFKGVSEQDLTESIRLCRSKETINNLYIIIAAGGSFDIRLVLNASGINYVTDLDNVIYYYNTTTKILALLIRSNDMKKVNMLVYDLNSITTPVADGKTLSISMSNYLELTATSGYTYNDLFNVRVYNDRLYFVDFYSVNYVDLTNSSTDIQSIDIKNVAGLSDGEFIVDVCDIGLDGKLAILTSNSTDSYSRIFIMDLEFTTVYNTFRIEKLTSESFIYLNKRLYVLSERNNNKFIVTYLFENDNIYVEHKLSISSDMRIIRLINNSKAIMIAGKECIQIYEENMNNAYETVSVNDYSKCQVTSTIADRLILDSVAISPSGKYILSRLAARGYALLKSNGNGILEQVDITYFEQTVPFSEVDYIEPTIGFLNDISDRFVIFNNKQITLYQIINDRFVVLGRSGKLSGGNNQWGKCVVSPNNRFGVMITYDKNIFYTKFQITVFEINDSSIDIKYEIVENQPTDRIAYIDRIAFVSDTDFVLIYRYGTEFRRYNIEVNETTGQYSLNEIFDYIPSGITELIHQDGNVYKNRYIIASINNNLGYIDIQKSPIEFVPYANCAYSGIAVIKIEIVGDIMCIAFGGLDSSTELSKYILYRIADDASSVELIKNTYTAGKLNLGLDIKNNKVAISLYNGSTAIIYYMSLHKLVENVNFANPNSQLIYVPDRKMILNNNIEAPSSEELASIENSISQMETNISRINTLIGEFNLTVNDINYYLSEGIKNIINTSLTYSQLVYLKEIISNNNKALTNVDSLPDSRNLTIMEKIAQVNPNYSSDTSIDNFLLYESISGLKISTKTRGTSISFTGNFKDMRYLTDGDGRVYPYIRSKIINNQCFVYILNVNAITNRTSYSTWIFDGSDSRKIISEPKLICKGNVIYAILYGVNTNTNKVEIVVRKADITSGVCTVHSDVSRFDVMDYDSSIDFSKLNVYINTFIFNYIEYVVVTTAYDNSILTFTKIVNDSDKITTESVSHIICDKDVIKDVINPHNYSITNMIEYYNATDIPSILILINNSIYSVPFEPSKEDILPIGKAELVQSREKIYDIKTTSTNYIIILSEKNGKLLLEVFDRDNNLLISDDSVKSNSKLETKKLWLTSSGIVILEYHENGIVFNKHIYLSDFEVFLSYSHTITNRLDNGRYVDLIVSRSGETTYGLVNGHTDSNVFEIITAD